MACKKMFGFLKVTDNDDLDEIQYENVSNILTYLLLNSNRSY